MKALKTDVAVIGGGPAGLAAALEASKLGAKALILERDFELGGILQQCIHDGFGLLKFGRRMSGCQYAQFYIDAIEEEGVDVLTDTMVLEITPDKKVYAVNGADGLVCVEARAVVLSMGCRERTRAQVRLPGTRPAGVFTAGTAQRWVNVVLVASAPLPLILSSSIAPGPART